VPSHLSTFIPSYVLGAKKVAADQAFFAPVDCRDVPAAFPVQEKRKEGKG